MYDNYDSQHKSNNDLKGLLGCMAAVSAFGAVYTAGEIATADTVHSRGHHIGYLTEIKEQGPYDLKTATMELHEAPKTNVKVLQEFKFSIRNDNQHLNSTLSNAFDSHSCVDISYTRTHGARPWQQLTHYQVTDVKVLGNECEF